MNLLRRVLGGVMLLGLLAAAAGGCGKSGEPAPRTAAERVQRAESLVKAGNEAYSAGDYRLAARRYAAAAVLRKDDPVAYYGMGMALQKLGRDEQARAAYSRARELAKKP